MRFESVKAKSLLSKKIAADGWFHVHHSMNAYQGCQHGCVYCDGMSEHYHIDNFMSHIRIKENAPELLEKELKNLGLLSSNQLEKESLLAYLDSNDAQRIRERMPPRPVIGISGGVSDAYQPIESKSEITRRILEVLLKYQTPVFILTKSNLVLRDIDLLTEINEVAFANVVFTITLSSESDRRIFEPRASSTQERFEALGELRDLGIHGGVMATPTIPYIGDTCENMTSLAMRAKDSKAEFIQFGTLTLKPGRQKELFMNVVRQNYPDKFQLISDLYSNDDYYGAPKYQELPVKILVRAYKICKKLGISDRSIRHERPGQARINTQIVSKLLDVTIRMRGLGYPHSRIAPYRDAAERIEDLSRNIEPILEREEYDRLSANSEVIASIRAMVKSGSCKILNELETEMDSSNQGCKK